MFNRFRCLLAVLVAAGVFSGARSADAVILPLEDLLNGGAITVGDVEFYDFSYTGNLQYRSYPPHLTPDVWPLRVKSVDGGLRFIGPLSVDWKSRGPGVMDFDISYRVRTPGFAVEGASLESTIDAGATALRFAIYYGGQPEPSNVTITQTIVGATDSELAILTNTTNPNRRQKSDAVNYEPASDILVTTNIRVHEDGGFAELREFTQQFSFTQGGSATLPSPTALMTLLPLAGGLLLHRQRGM